MSISPINAASVPPDPSVVGQATPETNPGVSSGSPTAAPAVQASGAGSSSGTTAAVSSADAAKAADALQNSVAFRTSGLSFSTDKESGLSVVTVTDSKTGDVIRKIPTDEALAITHAIDNELRGNLINQKA
ncbi:MAG: flagellin [Herbaspirillum sp.]|jgi:flagellar protein FlaG|nr:flagellin [Herbaspirillum sp.]